MKPPQGECCVFGPEILEFDTDGNVLKAWGVDNYVPGWPGRLQTLDRGPRRKHLDLGNEAR